MTALSRPEPATPTGGPLPRPVERADLPRVLEIERACFPSPWPRSAFELAVRTPRIFFRAAERRGRLDGYVVAVRDDQGVLIANLAVDPEARRGGLGGGLLEAAIEWGRVLRAPCCHLEVRVSNRGAIALYKAFGFRSVGIQRAYYRDPDEDALSMRLRLHDWRR